MNKVVWDILMNLIQARFITKMSNIHPKINVKNSI